MASKTGSTVVGELAMTRRMAPVARSRSSASVTSWNSRACPMAMAAWSAKLSRAAICAGVNGRASERRMTITPSTRSSLTRGTASSARNSRRLSWKAVGNSAAAASMSGRWTVRRSSTARPAAESRVSGMVSPGFIVRPNRPVMGHQAQTVAVESVDEAVGRAADPRCLFGDSVEHRLEVAGGARERAQDADGGGELLAHSRGTRGRRRPGPSGPGGMELSGVTPCSLLRRADSCAGF